MMKRSTAKPLQVGVFDFINSYPLFYPLRSGKIETNATFREGTPDEVNNFLHLGIVDIALISSVSYIDNRSQYILLSDYGVGARERVMSVGLFCRKPAFPFTEASAFLIPSHSMTSTRLLKVLSHFYWKSNATFEETSLSEEELFHQDSPFLLIGDHCLKRRRVQGSFLDLATAWNQATGTSFVFALLATRNEVFLKKREEVLRFHKSIIEAYAWSKDHENDLIHVCSQKLHIDSDFTKEYFRTLDYELSQEHIHGLNHFSSFHM